MLVELLDVKQLGGEPKRRWFASSYFDLIVWSNHSEEVIGFQLCYEKDTQEKALEWRTGTGWRHFTVNTGEDYSFKIKASPVLMLDGPINASAIHEHFQRQCSAIDAAISGFISSKLQELMKSNEV